MTNIHKFGRKEPSIVPDAKSNCRVPDILMRIGSGCVEVMITGGSAFGYFRSHLNRSPCSGCILRPVPMSGVSLFGGIGSYLRGVRLYRCHGLSDRSCGYLKIFCAKLCRDLRHGCHSWSPGKDSNMTSTPALRMLSTALVVGPMRGSCSPQLM